MNHGKGTPFILQYKQKSAVSQISQKSNTKLTATHWRPGLNEVPRALL